MNKSDDTISRQDAINALGEEPEIWNDTEEEWAYRNAWVEHISAIKALPSADRPTVDKEYLIDLIQEAVYDGEACAKLIDLVDRPTGECKDCTHWDKLDYEAPRQGWCYQFEEFTDADEYCSRCARMRGDSK